MLADSIGAWFWSLEKDKKNGPFNGGKRHAFPVLRQANTVIVSRNVPPIATTVERLLKWLNKNSKIIASVTISFAYQVPFCLSFNIFAQRLSEIRRRFSLEIKIGAIDV